MIFQSKFVVDVLILIIPLYLPQLMSIQMYSDNLAVYLLPMAVMESLNFRVYASNDCCIQIEDNIHIGIKVNTAGNRQYINQYPTMIMDGLHHTRLYDYTYQKVITCFQPSKWLVMASYSYYSLYFLYNKQSHKHHIKYMKLRILYLFFVLN